MFLQSIDISVDPCQDFYQFSCNKWIKNHPIPDSASSTISFGVVNQQILDLMSNVMAEANTSAPVAVQQAQMAYRACMKAATYTGLEILQMLSELGGLPMINPNWNPTASTQLYLDPSTLSGSLAGQYGINTFITPLIDTDWKNPTKQALYLDQATLYFPTIYYNTPSLWNSTYLPKYTQLITNVVTQLANDTGIPYQMQQVKADVSAIVNLEVMLASISVPAAKRRNYTQQYNPSNVSNANSTWPAIKWASFLNYYLMGTQTSAVSFSMVSNFIFPAPTYVQKLHDYVKYFGAPNATNWARTFQNYLMWRLLARYSQFIPTYKVHFKEFKISTEGVKDLIHDSSSCASFVINKIPYPASRLYIDTHFNTLPSNTRSGMKVMIANILSAFTAMVSNIENNNGWMDYQTLQGVKSKVQNLVKNVAYPDWIMNNDILNAHTNLSINSSDNFLTVFKKLTIFNAQSNLNQLAINTIRSNFLGPPAIVNAWYQPELNSITFPAGIINPPFFSTMFPNSVNYGGMGVVMGHELTHAFDDEGVQWGPLGKLSDWMDAKSYVGFRKMADCVVNEYNGFCYPNSTTALSPRCVSGTRTQGENIADNGGIQAAYNAYKKLPGPQQRLPGIMSKYSHDQLFFMSFAQVWCRNVKMSAVQRQLLIDPHSPAKFRVKGTVQNFPAFAQAFNCSKNVNQNRCHVWSL